MFESKKKTDKHILFYLDLEMKKILDAHIPDCEKTKLYNEAQQKSQLFARKSVPDSLPVEVVENESRSLEEKEILKKVALPKKNQRSNGC